MRQLISVSIGLCLLIGLGGCGAKRPKIGVISGTITHKGRPLNGAALLLYPAGSNTSDASPITIPVTDQGTFRITDVPPGEYKIVVQGTPGSTQADLRSIPPEKREEVKKMLGPSNTAPTIPFPDKYKKLQTTDLKCTITDQDQTLNLELKG